MKDPREAKLPKWAKDMLYEERRVAALSWPKEPEPKPIVVYDANGHATEGTAIENGIAWRINHGYRKPEKVGFEKGYVSRENAGFMSRASGAFYASERDANVALLWLQCRLAGQDLLLIQERIAEIDSSQSAEEKG